MSVSAMLKNSRVLLLGGGGLVGSAIAKQLSRLPRDVRPAQLILGALKKRDAERAAQEVLTHDPSMDIVPTWGDVLLREDLAQQHLQCGPENDPSTRALMLQDLYGDFSQAYERNHLVSTLRQYRPDVVIDCINTATVLAYRNTFDASTKLQESLESFQAENNELHNPAALDVVKDAELTMLTQTGPQLIRHVRMLAKVAGEVGVQQYIKIGTTGTGGMGMNIPYTHSEEKPSRVLLAKTEAAFGHSGLLMLWSQTPGAPAVKEIKPAAAVGYRAIDVRNVKDHFENQSIRKCRHMNLSDVKTINLREPCDDETYPTISPLRMAVVDLGENGAFCKDEFLTITTPDQMEMITPEEISEQVMEELLGVATGHNVLAAMRGALLGPGYRAGIQRSRAEIQLAGFEGRNVNGNDIPREPTAPSIALGKLGPPQLSKLLFEANILHEFFGTFDKLAKSNAEETARTFGWMAHGALQLNPLCQEHHFHPMFESILNMAPSIGVPILLEGNQLLRGPNISIPAVAGHSTSIPCPTEDDLDRIADQGWIDLRQRNIALWINRAKQVVGGHNLTKSDPTVNSRNIVPSDIVAWILSTEFDGHRDFV